MHFMFYPKDFVEKVLPTGMLSEVPANFILWALQGPGTPQMRPIRALIDPPMSCRHGAGSASSM